MRSRPYTALGRAVGLVVLAGCLPSAPDEIIVFLDDDPLLGSVALPQSRCIGNDGDNPFCLREVTLTDPLTGQEVTLANVNSLRVQNERPVGFLAQLDIDGDGSPDNAPDTDGDGLPDNWETGGVESASALDDGPIDRIVHVPAPTPIGPGTPPAFLTIRLAVATSAFTADTDGDGLSDFVEVFGLKFIDDNGNGILDFEPFTDSNGNGTFDAGEPFDDVDEDGEWYGEWFDDNGDGLPSVGEYPLPNVDESRNRQNDFDGFYFTDPTRADTDGDSVPDSEDRNPLLNPVTFGHPADTGSRQEQAPEEGDRDRDNDGLGDWTDLGNDLSDIVDYPPGLVGLIDIFRPGVADRGGIPEALVEDVLGADWNGDGLFQTSHVKGFSASVTRAHLARGRLSGLFFLGDPDTPDTHCFCSDRLAVAQGPYGERGVGMGYQELLAPTAPSEPFFPDVRVWAILYAWRVPGFDIDGDGYVGLGDRLRDVHPFDAQRELTLDGRVGLPFRVPAVPACGALGPTAMIALAVIALAVLVPRRRGYP